MLVRELLLAVGSDPVLAVSKALGRDLGRQEIALVDRAARQISDLIRVEMADEEETCDRRSPIAAGA